MSEKMDRSFGARELANALEYTQWRNFNKVIEKAMIACENSGHGVFDDFAEVSKIVDAGVTNKPIKDYELSRYACYLIVQNGDPRKEVIALGQTYFARKGSPLYFSGKMSDNMVVYRNGCKITI